MHEWEVGELMGRVAWVEQAIEATARLSDGSAEAKATLFALHELKLDLELSHVRLETRMGRLREMLRSLDRHLSGDQTKEQALAAIKRAGE